MAKVKRINDLDEDALDQLVISEECEPFDDRVEVSSAEVIDEEDVATSIDLAMEGKDVGVE